MRKLTLVILFFYGSVALAQKFTGQAALPSVEQSGFYKVVIKPEVAVHLNNRFTNIRIYDMRSAEVPYIFQTEIPKPPTVLFREYEVVEKEQKKGAYTNLVLRNPAKTSINNISLLIRNAEVTKKATLFGSDDKTNWFALKHEFILSNINNTEETAELKIVDFPLSNYEFYTIRINDKRSAPLNILKAGYYYYTTGGSKEYFQVPAAKMLQSDSAREKRSFVRLSFDTLRFVDKIEWSASGAPYYLRNAALYEELVRIDKKGKKEKYLQYISSVELNSREAKIIQLPAVKVRGLVLIIDNEDNPPLRVDTIQAYQLNRSITAWFEKDQEYIIKIGDENLNEPVYDIRFFKDSMPAQPPVLEAGIIMPVTKDDAQISTTIFTNKMIIWSAIIFVIVLLGFMSVKMIRETNVAEKQN